MGASEHNQAIGKIKKSVFAAFVLQSCSYLPVSFKNQKQ
jgi:hypothetical protein